MDRVAPVQRILKEERDLVIVARPLEATAFQVANIRMAYVTTPTLLTEPEISRVYSVRGAMGRGGRPSETRVVTLARSGSHGHPSPLQVEETVTFAEMDVLGSSSPAAGVRNTAVVKSKVTVSPESIVI